MNLERSFTLTNLVNKKRSFQLILYPRVVFALLRLHTGLHLLEFAQTQLEKRYFFMYTVFKKSFGICPADNEDNEAKIKRGKIFPCIQYMTQQLHESSTNQGTLKCFSCFQMNLVILVIKQM